ncbi:EspA/EspE family type VII secretion system effector [Mycolicibacterium monacense]|uniref:ESX-1 secretion-associated protein EspA/EspE-like domain-containing protein n=1 Tax=Mycolicibacterium monacense TaxID=85693 RepID=A0AAD1IZC0_MYCMB|nr:EspA/EspE family type VII secretion system effector [Mycolicibacterium monacense]OBB76925.1 hypothetical protein A6B34_11855 [Mycolicibacterium monacense]QHP84326.1 hypothetical protein EWR22_02530 [Mycolicibacterium monacense DSM 44395]BBZ62923.1 hypothetical protein MMON_42240 [Mycolicibacterium monacense]
MGLFDDYGKVLEKVGSTMSSFDPFGPIGAAGEMLSGVAQTAQLIDQNGVDALWNLAADSAEMASVAAGMLPLAKQTLIIQGGLKAVLAMQYECGFTNEPERADGYSMGAQRFNEVTETLAGATPDQRWTGAASDAYATANERQQLRMKKMVDADLDVRMALSAEAGAVETTRRILNNAATMMGNAIAPALAARALGKSGKALSLSIETAVVGVSVPTCVWYMNELANLSERSAASIEAATRLYEEVADDCYPTRM